MTLRPAFHEANRQRLIKKVTDDEPRAPRRIDASIPRDLETIVLKAIHKDPQSRYRKASQLADDLRSFLLDRPIRARRATLAYPPGRVAGCPRSGLFCRGGRRRGHHFDIGP